MEIFEQYLFNDITENYAEDSLSDDDYEELYERFSEINHLSEVKPFLLAMRYLGLGTAADTVGVIKELQEIACTDPVLNGLYYDLKLFNDENDLEALKNLHYFAELGYSDIYLKDRSHLSMELPENNEEDPLVEEMVEDLEEEAKIEVIEESERFNITDWRFKSKNLRGHYFTAGDVDYLYSSVYVEPLKVTKTFLIHNQIFFDGKPYSKVFDTEITLGPDVNYFETIGWGSKYGNSYQAGFYTWTMTIDGEDEPSFENVFRIYSGLLSQETVPIKNVTLYSSLEEKPDWSHLSKPGVSFDAKNTFYIHFKVDIVPPRVLMDVKLSLKIKYDDNNWTVFDDYELFRLNTSSTDLWTYGRFRCREGEECRESEVGFLIPEDGILRFGSWKEGLYTYIVSINNRSTYEGAFTVY